MGWEALERWGEDVARIKPLAGGVANEVWSVRVNGQKDGRLFADGLVVMTYLDGRPPETQSTGVAWPARSASCIG